MYEGEPVFKMLILTLTLRKLEPVRCSPVMPSTPELRLPIETMSFLACVVISHILTQQYQYLHTDVSQDLNSSGLSWMLMQLINKLFLRPSECFNIYRSLRVVPGEFRIMEALEALSYTTALFSIGNWFSMCSQPPSCCKTQLLRHHLHSQQCKKREEWRTNEKMN